VKLSGSRIFLSLVLALALAFSASGGASAVQVKKKKTRKHAFIPHTILPDIYPLDMPQDNSAPAAAGSTQPAVGAQGPCAAYQAWPATYAVCLDRTKKIQRLVDAAAVRTETNNGEQPETTANKDSAGKEKPPADKK
jgi:hypothetical protein